MSKQHNARKAKLGGEDITMHDIRSWQQKQKEKNDMRWVYKTYAHK